MVEKYSMMDEFETDVSTLVITIEDVKVFGRSGHESHQGIRRASVLTQARERRLISS